MNHAKLLHAHHVDNGRPQPFNAVLWPNQSLSPIGFRWVCGLVAAASFFLVLLTATPTLWPVSVFAGIDGFLLIAALAGSRNSMNRREQILIADGTLTLERYCGGQSIARTQLPLYGLKLSRSDDADFGCLRLEVVSSGRRFPVAQDLSPSERNDFATALDAAVMEHGGLGFGVSARRPGAVCTIPELGSEEGARP